MNLPNIARLTLGCLFAAGLSMDAGLRAQEPGPLALDTARVTIAGTSNVHAYTASTATVRVTSLQLGSGVAGPNLWDEVVKPGGLAAFEIAIPAASLTSPKDGLDKNMHKALKVTEHADITFRLERLEPRPGTPAGLRGIGLLRIAGAEKEVALDITTERRDSALLVKGHVQLLMTDFGITPPKAMLGMLKTDPAVRVSFETVFGLARTDGTQTH
jgi:hypothetical protein